METVPRADWKQGTLTATDAANFAMSTVVFLKKYKQYWEGVWGFVFKQHYFAVIQHKGKLMFRTLKAFGAKIVDN